MENNTNSASKVLEVSEKEHLEKIAASKEAQYNKDLLKELVRQSKAQSDLLDEMNEENKLEQIRAHKRHVLNTVLLIISIIVGVAGVISGILIATLK